MTSDGKLFTILSTRAPLVEVGGHGPTFDLPGGVTVADGAATSARVDLLDGFIRRWRVDAPVKVQTAVVVTDSPFGAFVTVRRCVNSMKEPKWSQINRWPRLRLALKRRVPSLLALWYLLADDTQPRTWRDVNDGASNQALAHGGDLIVVSFVSP
jgi:hypothetical protein